jgi:DNA-binding protein
MSSSDENRTHPANEIRVVANRDLTFYVRYGLKLFKQEERTLVLKGVGSATSRSLHIAEILKRRIGGLHQVNSIYTLDAKDKREGAASDATRHISVLEIVLSLDELDKDDPGYQEPRQKEENTHQPKTYKCKLFIFSLILTIFM